jgi:Tol biopolymer transport system component
MLCTGSLLHAQSSGQQLTFVRGKDIIQSDVDSGNESVLLADANLASEGHSWSPDGSKLAFAVGNYYGRQLHILDTSSGETYELAITSDDMVDPAIDPYEWSPDGQWIVYNLYEYDTQYGNDINTSYVIAVSRESQPQFITGGSSNFKWMPDSRHILYGDTNGYYRYDIATTTWTRGDLLPIPHPLYQIWSPDGGQVLYIANGQYVGDNDFLWLYDVETGEKSYVAQGYRLLSTNFSPNGQWVDYISDTRYWGEQMLLVYKPTGEKKSLDVPGISFQIWSPDSRMIAYTVKKLDHQKFHSPGGTLHIFNIETGEDRLIAQKAFPYIGWSPDSHWLAYQRDDDLYIIDFSHDRVLHIKDIRSVIGWRP